MTPIELENELEKLSLPEKWQFYHHLQHAMKTGVAASKNVSSMEPKHLRVGVNTAMVETGSICRLLIDKGIATEDEIVNALIKTMRAEVEKYERELSERSGVKITLGWRRRRYE